LQDADIDLSKLTLVGQGRTAEVFALDEDRVIKVAHADTAGLLEREAAAMRTAHAAHMPVPAAQALLDVAGRRALIMSRARGVDMLTQFGRRPWTIIGAGAKLGRLHAKLHETIAPAELPSLKQTLRERIATSERTTSVRERVLSILDALPDGDRLCHLDFHPANVIADGPEMIVIDWPGACRGDPLADVALTTIILRGGKTTPGTPLFTRIMAPIGRKLLLGGYARSYRKNGAFDRERFEQWLVVAAAMRLTYNIAGEAEMLLATIAKGA
jgi:Ser/Thr protein kinase RdoA (MazF antagonist)